MQHAMVLMIGVLCVLALAYRFYSKFLAVRVLGLDATRPTPAYTLNDGQNYHPTNKWVLFGHHFAAISGAGPLIGPVLAAQFGYLPGLLWILIGVVLGGAVQDFIVLVFSTRRDGKSLAQMAHQEIGRASGWAATLGILFVLVIALAGLGSVVVKALGGETVTYPAAQAATDSSAARPGTRFLSPGDVPTIFYREPRDTHRIYRISAGAVIEYPNGARTPVTTQFDIDTWPTNGRSPVELDVAIGAGGQVIAGKARGYELVVKEGVTATRAVPGSSWGTFTIALTIPIALFVGVYMYRIRKGKVLEASILGGLMTLGAVYLGSYIDVSDSTPPSWLAMYFGDMFNLSTTSIAQSMAVYGFIASVLPVWVLLCPRDYLSSFLKIGTVILLVIGVIVANPQLQAPAINTVFLGGGPIVPGSIFPFVFITIMCGAISGFHSLVASGTTPKMIKNETDARVIGYGAMLIEGLVGIVALVAAASLPSTQYYHMNTAWEKLPQYQQQIAAIVEREEKISGQKAPELAVMEDRVGESLQGRTGGAVTLAVGMAQIFDQAAKNILSKGSGAVRALETMIPFWYHFAIMFEALFILTTIDTGTRVGRFLLQEIFGTIKPAWGRTDWLPGTLVATGLLVGGWYYFIVSNSIETIWPMFGIANQLLAVMALAICSVALVRMGRRRYLWVTVLPMLFVTVTTMTTACLSLLKFGRIIANAGGRSAAEVLNAWINSGLIVAIVACTIVILGGALRRIVLRPVAEVSAEPAARV